MTNRHRYIPQFLGEFFDRFKRMPSPEVQPAWERLVERHRDHLEGVFEGAEFAPNPVHQQQPMLMRRAIWAAAAAVLLIAAVISVGLMSTGAPASVAAVDGGLHRLVDGKTQNLQVGETIQPGETIRSNGGSGGTLTLADGSRVEMRTRSELWLERAADGVLIQLRNGGIIVNAARQRKGHLYVRTKDVTVSVVGTVFLVNAEEEGSRVAVIEGEVRVEQGPIEKKLRPGQQVATNPSMGTHPVSQEISWSRNLEAHLAMLQQNQVSSQAPIPVQAIARPAGTPKWEVVSIRPCVLPVQAGNRGGGPRGSNSPILSPGRMTLNCQSIAGLIATAYLLFAKGQSQPFYSVGGSGTTIEGGPSWARSDLYTITAKAEGTPGNAMMQGPMLQMLLEDRFKLRIRFETREISVYELTVANSGSRLQPFKEGSCVPLDAARENFAPPPPLAGGRYCASEIFPKGPNLQMEAEGASVEEFAKAFLSAPLVDRRIINKTGLKGLFTFQLEIGRPSPGADAGAPSEPAGPSIFTALQEQLGLKLEPAKGPAEFLVIDSVERPSEN
jgi:uncharacterized protein (TIGR03435 family)